MANDIPVSVTSDPRPTAGEIEAAKAAERAARIRAHYEDRPTMSGVSMQQELERAAYRREQDRQMRLKPENWDRLNTFERDDMIGEHRRISEAAASHALMMSGMVAGKPSGTFAASHLSPGQAFLDAVDRGSLAMPSAAVAPASSGIPLRATFRSYAKGKSLPNVVLKLPESVVKGNPNSFMGPTDLGTSTIGDLHELLRHYNALKRNFPEVYKDTVLPKELLAGRGRVASLDTILADPEKRRAFYDYFRNDNVWKPEELAPNTGWLPWKIDGKPTPDYTYRRSEIPLVRGSELRPGVPIPEKVAKYIRTYGRPSATDSHSGHPLGTWSRYGELKFTDDVPLRPITDLGVVLVPTVRTTPQGVNYMRRALDRRGINALVPKIQRAPDPYDMRPGLPKDIESGKLSQFNDEINDLFGSLGNTFEDAKGGDARKFVHADAKGGDSPGPETPVSEPPVSKPAPQNQGGPRIVINPTTFKNKKDALCVAFNEAFRILMEDMSFSPVSEPTGRQREFFSDTAYANDEEQLRRTIIARIATFDTSVKDPTDEQLQETMEFLEGVMEAGYPQNEWEQSSVQRIHDVIAKAVGAPPAEEPPAEKATQADEDGGKTQKSDDLYLSGINGSDETIIATAAAGLQRPTDAQPQQPTDAQPQQPADAQPQQPANAQQNPGPAMGPAKKVAPVFDYFEIANQRRKTMYGDLD